MGYKSLFVRPGHIFDLISLCDFVISFVNAKEAYKISEVSDPLHNFYPLLGHFAASL